MNQKHTAKGIFTTAFTPLGEEKNDHVTIGKYAIDKTFTGDLEGTSHVEMLSAISESGDATYVAMEKITGTLNGKSGSFVVTHHGIRSNSGQSLSIEVVIGCSTGELAGMQGTMKIDIIDKVHYYEMEYGF